MWIIFPEIGKNIIRLLDNSYFEIIRRDTTFSLYVEVNEIYNLACPASLVNYSFDPVQTTKTSVMGVFNMLGLAKRLKIKRLVGSNAYKARGLPGRLFYRES